MTSQRSNVRNIRNDSNLLSNNRLRVHIFQQKYSQQLCIQQNVTRPIKDNNPYNNSYIIILSNNGNISQSLMRNLHELRIQPRYFPNNIF